MSARTTWLVVFVLLFQALLSRQLPAQEEEVDYTALAEPAFANRLALTDEQRAAVAQILDERVQKLVTAKPDERRQILSASNQKLKQLLTDE